MNSTTIVSETARLNITRWINAALRLAVHGIGLLPLLEMLHKWTSADLTANPIQFIEQFFGRAAMNLLVAGLAVTPLMTVTGWKQPGKYRRTLGLYAFFFMSLHFLTFAVLDYGLNFPEILRLTSEKPFIILGSLAGLILLILAATSFRFWMKRLGKNWKILHRSVYVAAGLVVLHYAMAVKGSLANLSGDILRPLLMGLLVVLLLVLRLPPIRRWIISLRSGAKKNRAPMPLDA